MQLLAVSDTVALGIITLVSSTISAIITGVVAVQLAKISQNQKIAAIEAKSDLEAAVSKTSNALQEISGQVEEVHKATNGMKDQLVKEVRDASFAKGVKSETDKGEHPNG